MRRVFTEQNPWWQYGAVPEALAPPTERGLARLLWQRLLADEPLRYQVVLGPRRVGKTTVLYQTVGHLIDHGIAPTRICWLRLDHPLLVEADLGDLVREVINDAGATARKPLFLMLDEVIYANEWDLWLKTFYDDHWPVRIAASSSATAALRQQRHESGVGRWEEQHLLPCRLDEHLELTGGKTQIEAKESLSVTVKSLRQQSHDPLIEAEQLFLMLIGGFPELMLRFHSEDRSDIFHALRVQVPQSQRILRSDAVERAIYKDIPQTVAVRNPMMLERLMYVLADQVTGILSPTRISQDLGLAQPTLDRYLSYLEQTYLIFTLTNYSGSESAVQRRGRKLFFLDSAVRNAALQRGLAPLTHRVELGMLRENFAAATLNALAQHAGYRLHHWRDGNREVDLIYDEPSGPLAFEIASSPNHSVQGLKALVERYPRFADRCYLVAPQARVIQPESSESRIGMLPLDTFLLAVGAQAQQAMLTRLGVPIG